MNQQIYFVIHLLYLIANNRLLNKSHQNQDMPQQPD